MTPLWVPLVVAALGFVSTLTGVVVTQILANRRERASWNRDLQREQVRWTREDQRLTFEQRRTAYVEFYESLQRMMLRAYDHGLGVMSRDVVLAPARNDTVPIQEVSVQTACH